MNIKKYILKDKVVGFLASSVAMQDAEVSFKKDSESSFYIATVEGEDIHIPENLKILEMTIPEPERIKPPAAIMGLPRVPEANSTDIVLKLHINQTIAPENISLLYEEISKAVTSIIKHIDD